MKRFFAAMCVSASLSAFAFASDDEPHFDIYLGRPDTGTQTAYGGTLVDAVTEVFPGERVFESEMGENPLDGVFFSEEPGFNNQGTSGPQAPGAGALLPGDQVTVAGLPITIGGQTADLFYWDGLGAVDFAPASGVAFVVGNPADAAASDGSFDDHPVLTLDDLDNNNATFPTVGIYLASFEASLPGLTPTDPLFLVMGTEGLITSEFLGISQGEFDLLTDEDLDVALEGVIESGVEFVETSVIPEPSALAVTLCLLAVGVAKRR